MVKVIAVKTINKTPPGGELEVSAPVAEVLVRLGNARYADEGESAVVAATPEQPRRRGRPPRVRQGDESLGVMTAKDFKKP